MQVRTWIEDDPDPATVDELRELVSYAEGGGVDETEREQAIAALADRFSGPLTFGTAGLRGALGAGPNRMNRAVVIRAAAGLMRYLLDELAGEPALVVIGYDARYGSEAFARDTADVVAAAGGRAVLLPGALPTPVLAFAVRARGADAGVMVTASHNPAQDNGYKVYLGGRVVTGAGQGAQIVPPADERIAAGIAAVPSVAEVPRSAQEADQRGGSVETAEAALVDAYAERAAGLASPEVSPSTRGELRIVLTPMHGVGGALAQRVLHAAGFADVHLVPEQAEPDPDFPTVAFPNPEEPGALDLALATAREHQADLVLANDPDADRCAVAVPDPDVDGGWRQLTGDEVGSLLGEQSARLLRPAANPARANPARANPADANPAEGEVDVDDRAITDVNVTRGARAVPVLVSSVVSSRMLESIANAHGLHYRATLTGFKWISRVPGAIYGYEEALGYCVDPEAVRDKDGISAAVRIADLAASLRAQGRTLLDALDDLARAHGVHATAPWSVRVQDLRVITTTMDRLREAGPTLLAGSAVVHSIDLNHGGGEAYPDLPATNGLLYLTEAGDRVIVRPSGTEPKLKFYLEVIEPVASGEPVTAARTRAAGRLVTLRADIAAAAGLP
ncbi:phospho-sugar mutase [Ruania halotolerans]|uniref:phospho-sugar mutase n=1 Tax=Ruania halotolerans TaxID=2897773 RepID=UPI001E340CAD|nr:phospho-sugar mutase [Ruania halotolerans]UFU08433.1 phospho-sugar mutase [Ruania halotolerans]